MQEFLIEKLITPVKNESGFSFTFNRKELLIKKDDLYIHKSNFPHIEDINFIYPVDFKNSKFMVLVQLFNESYNIWYLDENANKLWSKTVSIIEVIDSIKGLKFESGNKYFRKFLLKKAIAARQYYLQGKSLHYKGNTKEAIIYLKRSIGQYSEDPEAYSLISVNLAINNDLPEALYHLLILATKFPYYPLETWMLKHKLQNYFKQNEDPTFFDFIISQLKLIANQSKKSKELFDIIGDLYWLTRNKTEALKNKKISANYYLNLKEKESFTSKPKFLVIGAQKSGTTALYNYICSHSKVYSASQKEIFYFDTKFDFGEEWYLSHFPDTPIGGLTGEASATYFNNFDVPKRIINYYPEIKLCIIIRDPISRSISDYYMKVRDGVEKRSIEKAINSELSILESIDINSKKELIQVKSKLESNYVFNSLINPFLLEYKSLFAEKNYLIILNDELKNKPSFTMKKIFKFLNLPHEESTYPIYNKGNYSKNVKLPRLNKFFEGYFTTTLEII